MIFRQKRFPSFIAFVVVVLAGAGAVVVISFLRVGPSPVISVSPALRAIGRRTPATVTVSEPRRGLSRVMVELAQGEHTAVLADRSYTARSAFDFRTPASPEDRIEVELGRSTFPELKPGSATLRIRAFRSSTWLRAPDPAVLELTLPVRLTPPSIQVVSSPTYVSQGGCEAVVYRVGEASVRDGVRSGGVWFPGFLLPGGAKQDRFALFAVPWDSDQPDARIVAEDSVGNQAEVRFIDKFFPKTPKSDTIEVTDGFLAKVVPEILAASPEVQGEGSPLESYLKINGDLRRQNAETIRGLAAKSVHRFMWNRPFLQVPNGKVMSAFADRRLYRYNGREVDRQVHLGYDLAVTKRSPVPAANSGTVVLARYLGIYGNAVAIDHGYGLMTLYGHLSEIGVKEGQTVSRGDTVGRTGETGLAGGDHLHFTTLLEGLPVNPVEWWDGHWIGDRIAAKLPFLGFQQ